MAGLVIVLMSVGCGRETEAIPNMDKPTPVSLLRNVWDAGVVFPGESTKIAFPLDCEDVIDATEIECITTSCECVSATAHNFVDSTGADGVAVQIKVEESAKDGKMSRGHLLRVQLAISLKGGKEIDRAVNLLISGGRS